MDTCRQPFPEATRMMHQANPLSARTNSHQSGIWMITAIFQGFVFLG